MFNWEMNVGTFSFIDGWMQDVMSSWNFKAGHYILMMEHRTLFFLLMSEHGTPCFMIGWTQVAIFYWWLTIERYVFLELQGKALCFHDDGIQAMFYGLLNIGLFINGRTSDAMFYWRIDIGYYLSVHISEIK